MHIQIGQGWVEARKLERGLGEGTNVLRSGVRRVADRKGKGDDVDAGAQQRREGKEQGGQERGYYMGTNMDLCHYFFGDVFTSYSH